jgi:aminoglycoside phosphotransferase (APT) family kinase protein
MAVSLTESVIPESRHDAVRRALQSAFGHDVIDDLQPLAGGLSSALVFRMVVAGAPYLLRVIMRTDAMGDPTRQIAVMRPAADAGISPQVLYASVEDRVLITGFVEAQPFPADAGRHIARAIRALQTLPGFPPPIMGHYLGVLDGWVRKVRERSLLPPARTDEVFDGYEAIARVYPRDASSLVASHNDLKPENIRFDGTRMVFVDWEAAFLNDRFFDPAVAANFFVHDDAGESAFLDECLGRPAAAADRARFVVMRQIVHVAYASFLLMMVAGAGHPVDPEARAEDFAEFHQRLLAGEVSAGTGDGRYRYALVHLEQARRHMRTSRFEQALRAVSG